MKRNTLALILTTVFIVILLYSYHFNSQLKVSILYTYNLESGALSGNKHLEDFPALAATAEKYRNTAYQQNEIFFLADLGNAIFGTDHAYFSKSDIVTQLMNETGYDYALAGPKEFQYGNEMLNLRTYQSKFTYLATNITRMNYESTFPLFLQYHIHEVPGTRIKIAFMGIIDPRIKKYSPKNYTENMEFVQPLQALKKTAELVSREHPAVTVLFCYDKPEKIKQYYGDVTQYADIVISPDSDQNSEHIIAGNTEFLIDTGKNSISSITHRPVPITENNGKNYQIDSMITSYFTQINKWLGEIIGKTEFDFDISSSENTVIGNLTAAIIRESGKCDAGIINSDSFKKAVPAGDITIQNILELLPDQQQIVALKLTGKSLISIIRSMEKNKPTLCCSGISYSQEIIDGKKIISDIKMNGTAIIPEKYYSLATTDSLAENNPDWPEFNLWTSMVYRCSLKREIMDYIRINTPLTEEDLKKYR